MAVVHLEGALEDWTSLVEVLHAMGCRGYAQKMRAHLRVDGAHHWHEPAVAPEKFAVGCEAGNGARPRS